MSVNHNTGGSAMREVVVETMMSLDGYVAPVARIFEARTVREDPRMKEGKLERLSRVGTHIMGRVTFEEMATHWPYSDDPYAAPMNELPKVVFSKTLQTADWANSRIASGDLAEEIGALREQDGGDIIAWGGATFLQSLSRAGLVDEYRIAISPVAIGDGQSMFKGLTAPVGLELVQAETFEAGTALHTYRPRR
jgi:dihydrofolate reductase